MTMGAAGDRWRFLIRERYAARSDSVRSAPVAARTLGGYHAASQERVDPIDAARPTPSHTEVFRDSWTWS
jgi:hypothetical protein